MQITELWPLNARIVEIGAVDGLIGERLLAAGYGGYLGVTANAQSSKAIVGGHPRLAGFVTHSTSPRVASQNNAQALILSGASVLHLALFRAVRHAEFVAWPRRSTLNCVAGLFLAAVQWALGRLEWPQVARCDAVANSPGLNGQGSLPLVVCRVRKPRPQTGVRRFVPHRLGIAGFFRRLKQRPARYAVLRWFESLPDVAPGEDLDVLVDDADLDGVRDILDEGPGIQPVDVYSVSGLPGADYRSMPYFPPHLAKELLDRAELQGGLYRVPAPREHFLSLAYHALYHKGAASGLPARAGGAPGRPWTDHNYAAALGQAAERAAIDVDRPIAREALDACLDQHGWRPPHDMLVRLSRKNAALRPLLQQHNATRGVDDRLAVFLLREVALQRGGVDRATRWLAARGFRILGTQQLSPEDSARVGRTIRGGNWGRGPWPISGGLPVAAIVTFDPAPLSPSRRQRRKFPFVANARLLCKEELREEFNAELPADQHCNVIHSSDNGREASDYLRIIMPQRVEEILACTELLPRQRAA